jgi:hypothetical protein
VVFNTRAIEFGVPEEFTIRPSSNSDDAFHVSVFGQADNRFELRGDGRHAWGDGTNPVDLTLYRGTGGRLESNSEIFSAGGRLTANGASAPQFRISDVGAGNCQNSSCLGVVTTGNQFISGTAIGDSAFVAKTAGDFWIGTNTAGAQLARLRLLETGEFLGAQGTFGLGSALLSGAACVSADTGADRLYHDTDCDGTQDEDEEYLDYTTEGMGGGDIDAVFDCVTGNCNDIAAQAGDSLDMTSGDDSIPWLVKSDCGPETAQGKSCLDSDNNHFCIGDGTICRGPVMTRSIPFPAGALSVDGTQCSVPVERVINSGPKVWTVQCADSNGAIIYGSSPLPDGYNGSTFQFQLTAENENATPSGNMDMDFSCMCRGNGNEINSTWGTAQNAVISWSSYAQYEEAQDLTTAVTCDGPCLGSDTLYWRGVLDEPSTTTAQMGSIYFLHVLIEYERYMDD